MLRVTQIFGGGGGGGFDFALASNQTDYNLGDDLLARGWNGTDVLTVVCTIEVGVQINSSAVGVPAFLIDDDFPANFDITVVNNGEITGKGGAGGVAGGTAIKVVTQSASPVTVDIDNQGEVNGGGGGGAAGAVGANGNGQPDSGPKDFTCTGSCVANGGAGGGGGNGYGPSTETAGSAGVTGSCCGSVHCTVACGATGGTGGTGGGKGAAAGGAAGKYIEGDANVTWVTTGTRNGGSS